MTGWVAKLLSLFSPRVVVPAGIPATTLQTHLVQVAGAEIGVAETSRNRGPEIAKYWSATSYQDGMQERQPWCAAFVAWCLREAIVRRYGSEAACPFKRCRSARCFDWVDWANLQGQVDVSRTPKVGDIAVYRFSHIGIVVEASGGSDFWAIEGNTDDDGGREGVEVARRRRQIRQALAFLRLPA